MAGEFTALKNEVLTLRDELSRMKRMYEDLLYNLDDDNFADYIKREKENMKTEISITAEGLTSAVTATLGNVKIYNNSMSPYLPPSDADKTAIYYNTYNQKYYKHNGNSWVETDPPSGSMSSVIKQTAESISTVVSVEDLDARLSNYSTLQQTAQAISTKVSTEDLDARLSNYSTLQQTAQAISTKVSTEDLNAQLSNYSTLQQTAQAISTKVSTEDLNTQLSSYSTIQQTAQAISTKVSANYNEPISVSTPPGTGQAGFDITRMYYCTANKTFYYYNGATWVPSTTSSIYSLFEQNAGAIKLKANVIDLSGYVTFNSLSSAGATAINGANITTGTISAARINTSNLYAERLYSPGNPSGYYMAMRSLVGDFGLFKPGSTGGVMSTDCVFGVYNSEASNVANLYIYGQNYMGHNVSQGKTYPKGVWNFTSCTVEGLTATFG